MGVIGKSETITIVYNKFTDDLTLLTSPMWPKRFHKVIAYKAADNYLMGIDTDDLSARMSPKQKEQGELLKNTMIYWNTEKLLKCLQKQ